MVHRSSEDNHFVEGTSFPRKFPSSLSRKNSCAESINGGYREEYIFYRPPDKDYFEGPFTEVQCQFWYKEGCFYNGLEFKFGHDGPVETLESLKMRNGRECPFQEAPIKSAFSPVNEVMMKTMMSRIIDLAGELDKLKEEKNTVDIASKIENDSLKNRVKELMEKDSLNEQYRRKLDERMEEMGEQIAELTESLANARIEPEKEKEEKTDELETAFCENHSISEKTAADLSICEDLSEVRGELERLQNSVHSLDQFTFKLSHKIEKLKCKYKVIDLIGEGLNNKDGVFDRLAYLEDSVEEIQAAMEKKEAVSVKKERGGEKNKTVSPMIETSGEEGEVVLPVEKSEGERQEEGSIPEQWYSPKEKFLPCESERTLSANSFAAASESIVAVATAAWPGPEKMMGEGEDTQVDNWENIDDETIDEQWSSELVDRGLETPPSLEDTVDERMGDVNKENVETKVVDGADHLNLIGNGLGLMLQPVDNDYEDIAIDSDIDRLVAAIKGSKMLQIAESLKNHFGKTMICDVCTTEEKKAEFRNAIEYFEHLNRSHFKKCCVDKTLVNQFAFLLEQFKAAVPVPMALVKRQYAEREKNKPWLKREGTTSPTRKTPGKKRK